MQPADIEGAIFFFLINSLQCQEVFFKKIEGKLYFYEQAVLKYTNNLQYCFACPPEALDWAQGQINILAMKPPYIDLRGYCTSYQKLACFVLYLKIINNFLKN